MKKVITFLFSLVYFVASMGVALNIHYCDGEIENIKLFTSQSKCCCAASQEMTQCCDDETMVLQIKIEQQVSKILRIKESNTNSVIPGFVLKLTGFEAEVPTLITNNNLPPPQPQSLWLEHHSLIFYG